MLNIGSIKWNGVLSLKEKNLDIVVDAALNLLRSAVDDFILMRQREGETLKSFIEARLESMELQIQQVSEFQPQALRQNERGY